MGFSILIAFILTIVPLPDWLVWYRPAWVLMVLVFWVLAEPYRFGIFAAFIVGLLLDLLTGTYLGMHAFTLTLVIYFFVRFQTQIRSFPAIQKIGVIFLAIVLYVGLQQMLYAILGASQHSYQSWGIIGTTLLFWPIVNFMLQGLQHRFSLS